MIKKIYSDFFKINGIVVDNTYDVFVLHSYIKYVKNNEVVYLQSQDNDLSYLENFKRIRFLSVPKEAENINYINDLQQLIGLSIYSSQIKYINKDILSRVEFLEVVFDDKTVICYENFQSLAYLKIEKYPNNELVINSCLKYLELNYCRQIESLECISNMMFLENLRLHYLPKLKDITQLQVSEKSLISLEIYDCKNIVGLEKTLLKMSNLVVLALETENTDRNLLLKSVSFVNGLNKLEQFSTNYRIYDGDLRPLLKLKCVNITEFYKNYNIKDKYLPHKEVLIEENGELRIVDIESLPNKNEDVRIVWMDKI